jgi:hypothetical protein
MFTNFTVEAGWKRDLALIVLPALAMFVVGMNTHSPSMFADGDTNWHVATGRWILAHGRVPATDPFSFTVAGHPWVTHEWLSEVLLALVYTVSGWSGVMVLTSAAVAAVMILLATELRRWLGTLSVIATLGLSVALLLPHYMARPHIIALPLMVIWTTQLIKARRCNRTPPLWLLPIMTLWANLHGSFIFGLAFTSFFAVEAVLEATGWVGNAPPAVPDRQRAPIFSPEVMAVAKRWGAFLAGAGLMALITPNGIAGLIYPLHVMAMKNLQSIIEWQSADFQKISSLQMAIFFTLAVCLYRGVRIPAVRLGLLLLLLYMSLQHVRQEFVLAVIGPLLLAEPLSRALEPQRAAVAPVTLFPSLREIAIPASAAGLVFIAVAAVRLALPEVRTDRNTVPVSALKHVPPNLAAKPVFNDYSFGGWLIFNGVKPFMDGRSDMYGDDLLKLYLDVNSGHPATVSSAFQHYGIQWTILQPAAPLVALLDSTPGWHRIYADKWAVVQTRVDTLRYRPKNRGDASLPQTD